MMQTKRVLWAGILLFLFFIVAAACHPYLAANLPKAAPTPGSSPQAGLTEAKSDVRPPRDEVQFHLIPRSQFYHRVPRGQE